MSTNAIAPNYYNTLWQLRLDQLQQQIKSLEKSIEQQKKSMEATDKEQLKNNMDEMLLHVKQESQSIEKMKALEDITTQYQQR